MSNRILILVAGQALAKALVEELPEDLWEIGLRRDTHLDLTIGVEPSQAKPKGAQWKHEQKGRGKRWR